MTRIDGIAAALVLLWAGAALAFAVLFAPSAFHFLEPGSAGNLTGMVLRRLDYVAFGFFGLPLLLVYGLRWMEDFQEEGIGPLRLWSAAALAALLMTFASATIVTPRLDEIRARHAGTPMASLSQEHPDRRPFDKAHGLSRQLFGLRILLALGMAVGVAFIPKSTAKV
jgi:hypothetical protein